MDRIVLILIYRYEEIEQQSTGVVTIQLLSHSHLFEINATLLILTPPSFISIGLKFIHD